MEDKRMEIVNERWAFLYSWDDEKLKTADDEIKATYREYLDSLCAEDDVDALIKKACACYGNGNAVYGRDWLASQKCFLRAMQLAPDPYIANTLGYMYYYGRCNDGVPEYDKAYFYFSIGAAAGIPESKYKISDMFLIGAGVPKMPALGAGIIWDLYEEQLREIRHEYYNCDFADVALRAGNLYRNGVQGITDAKMAFYFYLQALFAIRMRRLKCEAYGDDTVENSIRNAMKDVAEEAGYTKVVKTVHYPDMEDLLQDTLGDGYLFEMTMPLIEEGSTRLEFKAAPIAFEDWLKPKLFITVPEACYCSLVPKLSVKVQKIDTEKVFWKSNKDTIVFDDVCGSDFYLHGEKVASIPGDYVFTLPREKKRESVDEIRKKHAMMEYDDEIKWCTKIINGDYPEETKADARARIEVAEAGKKRLENMK